MQLLVVFLAVAVLGLAALAAAGWFGQQQADPIRDVYRPPLDEERVRGDDLKNVRFALTPMGYDMAEVDEWMARLARELDRRDGVVSADDSAVADPAGAPRGTSADAE